MGSERGAAIDHWLADGGLVVTANERAARALRADYHRRRRAEGLTAWPTPRILAWMNFVRKEWDEQATDDRLVLNFAQEQALWAGIITALDADRGLAVHLPAPRLRLAAMAMTALELISSYAPKYLADTARSGWDRDAGAFSAWLARFAAICRSDGFLSASLIPIELQSRLRSDASQRQPLLIMGFDRMQPAQRDLFNAWGAWQELPHALPAREIRYFAAPDPDSELDACAKWATQQVDANPQARILIIDQNISGRRGEIERALLRHATPNAAPSFEFSLGIPLMQVPAARAALLLLRWLDSALQEHELDWLFSSGYGAVDRAEALGLQELMRHLRRRGSARTEWPLEAFMAQSFESAAVPAAWRVRLSRARKLLASNLGLKKSPCDWAGLVPRLLEDLGLPGEHRFSSAEFQAWRSWEHALDTSASLGVDGRLGEWNDYLAALAQSLEDTLFAPESTDAPIQITGPAEAAGLTADAIWFMGAHQDAWPPSGSTHPFIPLAVQRASSMPHASPQVDWQLGQAITMRLLASAGSVFISYAQQAEGAEARDSHLVRQFTGSSRPLPDDMRTFSRPQRETTTVQDFSRVPFLLDRVTGGSGVLTKQSQCAFQGFATARLGARGWDPAEFGFTAAQRGSLVHAVLQTVWAGPPDGLRSLADLRAIIDKRAFVANHVEKALQSKLPAAVRGWMPRRYLELEAKRLTRLLEEWLEYEATRVPFSVETTEDPGEITVAGIAFKVRIDRVDRLTDGSLFVIDYKTGEVSPKDWELPRPADVQLPLYACFGIDRGEEVGGLVFAKVRPGELEFAGRIRDARNVLFIDAKKTNGLVKKPLTAEQFSAWKKAIEQLARDFLAGRADVDPRDLPETCELCGLQTLCRVSEADSVSGEEIDEFAIDEGDNE